MALFSTIVSGNNTGAGGGGGGGSKHNFEYRGGRRTLTKDQREMRTKWKQQTKHNTEHDWRSVQDFVLIWFDFGI